MWQPPGMQNPSTQRLRVREAHRSDLYSSLRTCILRAPQTVLSDNSFPACIDRHSPLSMTIGDGQPIGLGRARRLGRSILLSWRRGSRWGGCGLGLGTARGRRRSGLLAGLAGHEALGIGERRCRLRQGDCQLCTRRGRCL